MNKFRSMFLLVTLVLGAQIFSEDNQTSKIYYDTIHKKVYLPVAKPFYIKLSESIDSNASSVTLFDDKGKFGKGFQLNISGTHSLRWINPFSRDTANLSFIADGERPKVNILFLGTKYKSNSTTFYGRGLRVVLNAFDHYSGIEGKYASIDNGNFTKLKDTLRFDTEKQFDLKYYVMDNVGNKSESKRVLFSTDLTAPHTIPVVSDSILNAESILSKAQNIKLDASDSLSGVKETWYKFDQGSNFLNARSSIALTNLKDGNHSISFFSVDNVGNTEEVHTVNFFLDNSAPTVSVLFNGDKCSLTNGLSCVSPKSTIQIDANDNKSGIEKIEYILGDNNYIYYSSPFSVPVQNGKVTLGARAVDKKGNVSPLKYVPFIVDSKPPHSHCTFSGAQYKKNNILYISPSTNIILSAEDDIAGIKQINYLIGDSSEGKYSMPFSIKNENKFTLRYFSIDNVANKEDTQSVTFMVDTTPPKIFETFSNGTSVNDSQSVVKIPPTTSLFLAATDNSSGVNQLYYSINNSKESKYTGAIVFENKGLFTIAIKCKDNVGNTKEDTLSVEVSD